MFIQTLSSNPQYFLAVCIAVVVSICIHELAHGVVAVWCGDRTPIELGHMTLNPAAHISPMSIVCLMLAGIAWGAMPVDRTRMKGRYADGIVAAAGPISNVILALLAVAGLGLWQRFDTRLTSELPVQLKNLQYLLWVFGAVNLHLALFNLVPIPPLDGSCIAANLSRSYATTINAMQANGGLIVGYILLFSVAGSLTRPVAVGGAGQLLEWVRGF